MLQDVVNDPEKVVWDVIVVGAGMGGGPLGLALARAGYRVLFVERGRSRIGRFDNPTVGRFPEEVWDLANKSEASYGDYLLSGGRFPAPMADMTKGRPNCFVPHIGCGVGGSSALYGMVLERFFPADFTPGTNVTAGGKSTLPDRWPISYEDMAPWYNEAERLFRVRGTIDPLRPDANADLYPPPALGPGNQELFSILRRRGMHPYHLHIACECVPGCSTCQSYLCPRGCKNDAGRICVTPAVCEYGAALLDECAVVRLEASRTEVERVICAWQGRTLSLHGRFVALAAGAMGTPSLLLQSASALWPRGLANTSDMVGRNLMRHLLDLYLLTPARTGPLESQHKAIGFNDLYFANGQKFGTVQSFGALPSLNYLLNRPGPSTGRRILRRGRFLAARPWERFRQRRLVLASILEDLPYAENRILPSASERAVGRLAFQYQIHQGERARQKEFRAAIAAVLKPTRYLRLNSDANTMLAHACGTCRFGSDPRTSVLDATNRAHDLSNLYVCDASFFPSSGGINPALTVAANALRVAAHIQDRL